MIVTDRTASTKEKYASSYDKYAKAYGITTDQATQTTTTEPTAEETAAAEQKAADASVASAANTKSYADQISGIYDLQQQAQEENIDYQTNTNIQSVQRTYEDGLQDYRDQYRDYTNSLYQGSDNAALNARANGQFGGTATANAAAVRSQYQQARNELSTQQRQAAIDTVNQINQLRMQGEYDKADAYLQNQQDKFAALYDDAIRVDENEYSNYQYQTSLDREDAAIQRTQENNDLSYIRQMGMTLLSAGIVPDSDVLEKMGMSETLARTYANMVLYGL